jgi:hypothetical protein
MANKAGGGINSRNVVRPGVRNGAPARAQSPRGVSQYGSAMGNHATEGGGRTLKGGVETVPGRSMPSVKLGNEVAASTVSGPGGSRTVMRSGSQGQTGPAAGTPKPAGRDILSSFGSDSPGVRDRR